jgi:hypothetical protein
MSIKKCSKCGVKKDLSGFHRDPTKSSGFVSHCKDCKNKSSKSYRSDNPKTPDQREYHRVYSKQWYQDNPGYSNVKYVEFCNKNPGYAAAKDGKRRAAKLNATPSWLNVAHHAEVDGLYLYNAIMPGDWHVDHIEALQGEEVSGLHVPWNLRVISSTENLSKGNRREAA